MNFSSYLSFLLRTGLIARTKVGKSVVESFRPSNGYNTGAPGLCILMPVSI